jgi:molybdopterin-dependent oxidoreductase alpha subunit
MKPRHLVPFGLLEPHKPRHFRETLRVLWQNRDSLPYAWRILRDGVCDGCSLGPYGLRDNVIPGMHLCTTRLTLLRLNTMGALDPAALRDVRALERSSEAELRALGRLPCPLVREGDEPGFRAVSWDDALAAIATRLRGVPGERMGFFATSRGITNEAYYTFQKAARLLGSNHVDLCSRLCHAASVSGLSDTLGVGAPTCSLSDLIGADLVVLLGTDLPNNQPVATKYLERARREGTRIVVVNPYREPGLERYWIPSVPMSALFGTPLMDDFFQINVGGDIAFLSGVVKRLIELDAIDERFVAERTDGFYALRDHLAKLEWAAIEAAAGVPHADIDRFAKLYAGARHAVFVYSMGLTQHRFGSDNVRAVVNLALARGMVGRPKTGILPIRGHSGVQGGGECGVDPGKLPGGIPVGSEAQAQLEQLWGHSIPRQPGRRAPALVDAAGRGEVDLLYSLGGNLLDTLPDRDHARSALSKVRVRIHQDLVVNPSALIPAGLVVLLPAQTRYEQAGGGTSTNTERRIRFSPEIEGHPQVGTAKAEWEIPCVVARHIRPELASVLSPSGPAEIRHEMGRAMPTYAGVEELSEKGDWIQWGGPQLFREGFPNMPGGRARFSALELPDTAIPEGRFYLTTRRGKQFNSMVYRRDDPLTGAERDAVFMSPDDASRLGLDHGSPVELRSETGTFRGRVRVADVKARTLQVFWPEGNTLIPRRYDPDSGEPDYNAFVEVRSSS